MAAGEVGDAFTHEHAERIEAARAAAERQTGMVFTVRVGETDADPRLEAESLLANIVEHPATDSAVLILVAPGARRLEIMTTAAARRRVSDQAAGLAVLSMTSSFNVGDLVGGLVNALRQLADSAGRPPGSAGRIELGGEPQASPITAHH